jgi:hypothetical protein
MVSVIAVNSSPKMDKGNTALVLKPFLEGMRSEDAEVEIFYTKKLDIKPCTGEFKCWGKSPGKCYIKDDMQTLLPKFRDAEIWVFASLDGVFLGGRELRRSRWQCGEDLRDLWCPLRGSVAASSCRCLRTHGKRWQGRG